MLSGIFTAQAEQSLIEVQLLSERTGINSGNLEPQKGQLIGLKIQLEAGWHLSWDNYEGNKSEPSIQWDLPSGFTLEPIVIPKPEAYSFMGLASEGYKDTVLLLYRLTPPIDSLEQQTIGREAISLVANIRWLLCKDICIPGETQAVLELSVADKSQATEHAPKLKEVLTGSQLSLETKETLNFESQVLSFGLLGWLGLAFLGGLILNLMPCVLPVLSIKLMSLFESAHQDQRKILLHGCMYALGTVSSFIILALVLFTLRSFGESVGWGFQLQDPYFVTFLIALFFLIGMNMIGVFEVGLSLVGIGAKASSKQSSPWASLGTGILATIAGAPCVGPFIGGVSGLALQADLWTGLSVFGFMGLGMASPFLLCAVFPNLLKCLPKPGPWMQVFRQIMGMLLIGSAAFLVWVVQQSTGNTGLLYLLCFLVLIALSGWVYGRWGSSNYLNPYRNLVSILATLLVLGGFLVVSQNIAKLYGESMNTVNNAAEDTWASWSEDAVDEVLSNGRIAFVDFTASWCLICQSNKVLVLRTPETAALFEKYKVVPFTADWTLRNSKITRALESYKRSGVPLYLFLTPEGGHKVLPQNLSHSIMEAELLKLSNKN